MRFYNLFARFRLDKLKTSGPAGLVRTHPKKTIASVVGIACAGILTTIVPQFEGTEHVGYLDPIGIPTKCMGDTNNVVVGHRYTEAECLESLETQLIAHAEPVLECTPSLAGKTHALAAAVSFAYNVGVGAYCSSTMARKIRMGDLAGGCAELNRWVYAGGRKLAGLVARRAHERALCEQSL